jgi:hypothetical protein
VEAKKDDAVSMSAPSIVVDIPDRHIDWPILIVSRCDRYCGLITAEDDRNEYSTMRGWIFTDFILLQILVSRSCNRTNTKTYRLSPCPISGHKVLKYMAAIGVIVIRRVVEFIFEIGVGDEVVQEFSWISEPYVILSVHP